MKKSFLVGALVLAMSVSVFAGCAKTDKADSAATEEQADVSVAGTYVYSYTEEMEGEELEFTNIIVLNDDNTCEVTFQDTLAGKWDGSKITLENGSEFEYKIEDGNLSLNQDGEWYTYYAMDENNINPPIFDALEAYSSIIADLKPGQAYAFASINPSFDALLVSEDGAYDVGDGKMGSISALVYGVDADGNIIEYGPSTSGHTAYPLAVYDGCLMTCNNARTMMERIDSDTYSMITWKVVETSTDEDGNTVYSYMDAETQTDGVMDDDSMMQEIYDMYDKATVINFTVVE